MSMTPQVIKDQEFQIKFRGYDAIEVKAYLDLLAEEFFELYEQNRVLAEDIEGLTVEKQTLESEREKLEKEIKSLRDELQQARTGAERKDDDLAALQQEIKELKSQLDGSRKETDLAKEVVDAVERRMKSEQEKAAMRLREEVEAVESRVAEEREQSGQLRLENEQLRQRLELLEQQHQELKKDEMDFKTAIVAAQKFSEDLRRRVEEETAELMEKARQDVELFRRKAHEELARLPIEIERLQNRRVEVREELKSLLSTYLQQLDTFPGSKDSESEGDLMELYQTIQLPDVGALPSEEIDTLNPDLS
ncbi:DivIVA domain-containing protein [Desulfoprunum benzoelyticum]|uniref:DivIVA domain-containing protein n=1 Tax=Desulfoprunum benzoelyticum TaxID=1506996 RepID=A0A840UMP0_9BACT|nr:DivIVA domain-containing protein [Desulfoprunum benzoelyticum]MBB5346885.1 DivIVA domain-containing protein [Desulfoprunum benzoelyticum]MBM9529453.1 DivIVA domain-containing protein [Desulfoprunum benzoelyticum]